MVCFGICLVIGYHETHRFSFNSPGNLVKAVVSGYQNQNNALLRYCYEKSTKQILKDREIQFQKKFYLSVDARAVKIQGVEKLFQRENYECMGVYFDFLRGGKSIPFYEYYFVHKTEKGRYEALTSVECPRTLLDVFEKNKDKMQESSLYRKYMKQTKRFSSENPSISENIYGRFQDLLVGVPPEMKKNLKLVGDIFLMAIVELGIACILIFLFRIRKRFQNTAMSLTENRRRDGEGRLAQQSRRQKLTQRF